MGIDLVAFRPHFAQNPAIFVGHLLTNPLRIARPFATSGQMGIFGLAQDLLGLFQSICLILVQVY